MPRYPVRAATPGTISRRDFTAGPMTRPARSAKARPPPWTPVTRGHRNNSDMKTIRSNSLRSVQRKDTSVHAGLHLVIAGAGGNIGSHLVPLLARQPGVARLTLVDFDRYEAKNLCSQDIEPADLSQPKAEVQARRARRINPKLEVRPILDRLENVPLGRLRGDVLLGCLDSKASRRFANEIAWRLGMKFIDAGVEASALLARVNTYVPAEDQPCYECAWDERDYAETGTRHPCDLAVPKTPPTNAPACLGALAAALQAIECEKLLRSGVAATAGEQVLIEAATHHHYLTRFSRNPKCRFDHATWAITALRETPRDLTIDDAFSLVPAGKQTATASLGFGGRSLVQRLNCPGCGFSRRVFKLRERLIVRERSCPKCQRELLAAGFYVSRRLIRSELAPDAAARTLASLGLCAGDVISVSDGVTEKFFELGAQSCRGNTAGLSRQLRRSAGALKRVQPFRRRTL